MIIETWILAMIVAVIFILGLTSIIGWIFEGERTSKAHEEIKKLQHENAELKQRIARRNAIENIKVATEFYNNKEN